MTAEKYVTKFFSNFDNLPNVLFTKIERIDQNGWSLIALADVPVFCGIYVRGFKILVKTAYLEKTKGNIEDKFVAISFPNKDDKTGNGPLFRFFDPYLKKTFQKEIAKEFVKFYNNCWEDTKTESILDNKSKAKSQDNKKVVESKSLSARSDLPDQIEEDNIRKDNKEKPKEKEEKPIITIPKNNEEEKDLEEEKEEQEIENEKESSSAREEDNEDSSVDWSQYGKDDDLGF